jgi:tRNA1(Val) A37 N6-methylase TrmN6
MDLGTGCGVLTFYMLKHNVKSIVATDINPNALKSLEGDLKRVGKCDSVSLSHTSFFDNIQTNNLDLVVFNPPWIPEKPTNSIDLAMYYEPSFFEEFFSKAHASLPMGCTVLVIFSTFAQAAGLELNHPIAHELESNSRFKLVNHTQQKLNQKPSARKHWLSDIRAKENIELWELLKI